ncbi:MAG: YceI family protein [Candidatus Electryonea clarkiae]|nr:YceI family protein [Candidatus Electryonea clarkiae]MDP8286491.1 YceI family protein [Candidatus Electryonea clarkiae]
MSKLILSAGILLMSVFPALSADWELDTSHSSMKFKVKHLMVSNVYGEFTNFTGNFQYDEANPQKAIIDVTVDMSSITTGNEKRDAHLKSADFFDIENFPEMTFESTRIKKAGKNLKLIGALTMRGVTREIELLVDGPTEPVNMMGSIRVGASATGTINRLEWGVSWSKALETGAMVVSKEIDIIIDLELIKKS